MLARLLRLQPFLLLLISALALASLWRIGPWLALAAAGLCLGLPFWILGLQFLLMPWVHGQDPTPRPHAGQRLGAWAAECIGYLRVFFWRQPWASQAEPDFLPGRSQQVGVLLVHGFVCNRGLWTPWLRQLRRRGHPCIALDLEPVFGSIDDYAPLIEQAVRRLEQCTGRAPVLVCHSMGGLAARAWLRSTGDAQRVARVITLGTPHHGTWLARFALSRNGRQMRQDSRWLQQLAAQEGPALRQRFTCWYGNCDNIVMPPRTATLDGADNRLLPGQAHVALAFHPAVMQDTWALLRSL